jgi:glycosyltransferase involved in cell wall biosynthesis
MAGPRRRLWRLRYPSDEEPVELYLRTVGEAHLAPVATRVELAEGGVALFDTYFNAFSVSKWLRHTTLRGVELQIETRGDLRLEVVHDRLDLPSAVVAAAEVDSSELVAHQLTLPPLAELASGSMYLRATCRGGCATVTDAAWCTRDVPSREARFGIVITTFNRPDDVRANVMRLLDALTKHRSGGSRPEVVVVDNGQNLDLGDFAGDPITVLSNPNTGGAGGFARGLMHLRATGRVTHVLFMDDDVAFDPDIVFRTVEVLSFARDPLLCVAGTMLDRAAPTTLFEAGAQFLGTSVNPHRALGQSLDLARWRDCLRAECDDERIDYGAWWFFAFPIELTHDNPIPAFVRGDDVCWGLLHARNRIVTFNGIGLWHEGFELKNGPMAWFYETRNFALVSVLAVPGYRWWHLLARYVQLCFRSLVSLKYASAANITFGMREFLRGPQHWLSIDQEALNERVKAFEGERVELLSDELTQVEPMRVRRGMRRYTNAILSVALLGGHLLPRTLDRKPLRAVPIQQRLLGTAPGNEEILYRDSSARFGFVARRDRRRFFGLLREMIRTAARIPWVFERLKRRYRDAYPQMVSDEYWTAQLTVHDRNR